MEVRLHLSNVQCPFQTKDPGTSVLPWKSLAYVQFCNVLSNGAFAIYLVEVTIGVNVVELGSQKTATFGNLVTKW